MRKKIIFWVLSVLFFISVLPANAQIFFEEDFENGGAFPAGWTLNPGGTGDNWAIDDGSTHGPGSAHSGTYTAMFDDYNFSSGTTAEMITPAIDLSSTNPGDSIILNFWYWDSGGTDVVDVLVSTDGTNYTSVYNTPSTVNPWTLQVVDLSAYAGAATLYISFKGQSVWGVSNPNVDDVSVQKIPANDLAALSWDFPQSGCGMSTNETVVVEITNLGADPQSTFPISYSIDNGSTWVTETYTGTINSGDTLVYTFSQTADFSALGTYNVLVAVNNPGDTIITSNNTLHYSIESIPIISSFPYYEDFESGSGGWVAGGTNSTWELGTPAGSTINTAASGSNSWMTGLTGNYNNSENSYVESPCFDFTTIHNPLLQMNVWCNSENSWDGAAIYYSVDGGNTWILIGDQSDWMNWYNDGSISGLNFTGSEVGWTDITSTGWTEVKHLLSDLAGESSVRFRIYFGSDGSVNGYDGFAFDDFTIREGDINLAITEINYNGPEVGIDTTEFIEWYNYGQDAVNINGFYYSQGVTDTLPDVTVLPGEFFVSAYDSTVMVNFFNYTGAIEWGSGGLANSGEDIALHTPWGALVDSVYYDDANGWPIEPDGNGPTLVFCEQNIGQDVNDPANWNISSSFVDTLNGMPVYASPGALDNICLYLDLAIAGLQTGDTIADCGFTGTDTIFVELTNVGNIPIPSGDTIFGWYQMDTNPVEADTMVLNADLNPGDTIVFIFGQTIDLSGLGYYSGGVWFNHDSDPNNMNDTAYVTLNHYEVVVDLGPDTIWTTQPDTVVLDAGQGFMTYLWQDGSTAQTFTVSTYGTYYVQVIDSNWCEASDTIVIELLIDLTIAEPEDGMHYYDCDINDTIEIAITNLGATITAPDTIYLWYKIDNGTVVEDTLFLSSDFNTGDTLGFIFDQTYDFSALTTYNWYLGIFYPNDMIPSNDSLSGQLTHYETVVNLGSDTMCTSQPDTVVLDAGQGFMTYLWQDGSTAQTFTVSTYGTYYVQVIDTNWCEATDTIVIDNCVGIEDNVLSGISIYPNPNNGQFILDLPRSGNIQIEVMTISGQVIYSKQTTNVHNIINLKEFGKGIYFVRITDKTVTANYKIVIQ